MGSVLLIRELFSCKLCIPPFVRGFGWRWMLAPSKVEARLIETKIHNCCRVFNNFQHYGLERPRLK